MKVIEKIKKLGKSVGPGIITGASDDDPSGILTYLQSGFVLGFRMLWLAVFCLPFMYVMQEMASRIGYVTDKGLMKVIKEHYPRWILYIVGAISVVVITVNIGADLLAIGVVSEKLTSISRFFWLPAAGILISFFTIFLSYPKFASIMKWLIVSLFFYIIAAFYMGIDWKRAFLATIIPSFSFDKEFLILFTAFLGTTISPYLFFWQADEEVEERNEEKKEKHLKRFLVTKNELKHLRKDTFWGMFFSQLVTWFIVAAAGQAAVVYGAKEIVSFDQAALVLRPLLGGSAFFMFSLGIIGTGLIAVPVLAGSVGYALSEIFNWKEGINKTFRQARGFYMIIIAATLMGITMNFLNLDPIKLLIYTAVLYTIITPPLIFLIIRISNNKKIMGKRTNSWTSNIFGWLIFAITLGAAIFAVSLI